MGGEGRRGEETYSTYYIVMIGEVSFAVLAAVYLVAVQINVVNEAHGVVPRNHLSSKRSRNVAEMSQVSCFTGWNDGF